MSSSAVLAIFISALLISLTAYSLWMGFGSPSDDLRDPFDE